jgi:hypothetical protein
MRFLLQAPIVVDVVRQPPVTPEITYPQVIVGAVGVAGGIMLLAALAGLLMGAVIIALKKRGEAASGPVDSGHARLRI